MQFKVVSALIFATLAAAVTAPPFDAGSTVSPSKCGSDNLRCCKTVLSSNAPAVASLISPYGLKQSDISGFVGSDCEGLGINAACSGTKLCCAVNSHGKLGIACNKVN